METVDEFIHESETPDSDGTKLSPYVIDVHDTQTLSTMSDRELLETMVAYLGSLDNRLANIEQVHTELKAVADSMMSNPMLSMLMPK